MASDRDLAERVVRAGAAAALRVGGADLDVRRKSSAADLVSAADHASEQAIVALLRAERPDDAILGEEGASVGAAARRWLVDGVDGTVNFLRAIPQWCVAVVLEEDGEPLATAVLDPVARRAVLRRARRGRPPRRRRAARARGRAAARGRAVELPARRQAARHGARRQPRPPRRSGRGAAHGRRGLARARLGGRGHIDAWAQPNVDPWDWLPGRLLVEEAGGRTRCIDGDPLTWFVAAAPGTFDELVALVSSDR